MRSFQSQLKGKQPIGMTFGRGAGVANFVFFKWYCLYSWYVPGGTNDVRTSAEFREGLLRTMKPLCRVKLRCMRRSRRPSVNVSHVTAWFRTHLASQTARMSYVRSQDIHKVFGHPDDVCGIICSVRDATLYETFQQTPCRCLCLVGHCRVSHLC